MPRSIDAQFTVEPSGALKIPTDLEYVAQRAVQRLRFLLGESFRRPDEGIPYFQDPVIGSRLTPEMLNRILIDDLTTTIPEISGGSVLGNSLAQRTRHLAFRLALDTVFGPLALETEI